MVLENKYLTKAVEKAGYVVIVKRCNNENRKGELVYLSPNAKNIGMNVACLTSGIKLSEDYIHPDDRQKVIQTVVEASKTGVDEYIHEYRMVGDDGVIRYVSNEICVTQDGDDVIIECYIKVLSDTEPADSENIRRIVGTNQAKESKDISTELTENEKINTLLQIFAKLSGLYSVMVDGNRRVIYQPIGPATNMGDFYDLFEKPNYKEYFESIKQRIIDENQSLIVGRAEGGIGKISVAPIKMGEEIKGYWVVGSYTEKETEKINIVYEYHWYLAELISSFICNSMEVEEQVAKTKGAGAKLREYKARQGIIKAALKKSNSSTSSTVEEILEEILRDVGMHMAVNDVSLYTSGFAENNEYVLRAAWNVDGQMPGQDLIKVNKDNFRVVEQAVLENKSALVIDGNNMTEPYKILLMRHSFKSLIAQPIFCYGKLYGILFFGETRIERLWTGEEIDFSENMGLLVQNILEKSDGKNNVNRVNEMLVDTYNNFDVGIFVRDAYSGVVLFSNIKMNKMMGEDITGKDSREIITDLRDRFDNIGGMRKPFITKDKVVKWRSYIQCVDNIMDITEIQMEWLNGEHASLIILRKAKDL